MIKPSEYYSLVAKDSNVIIAKGSKKNLLKIIKANRGSYSLCITSTVVGDVFINN